MPPRYSKKDNPDAWWQDAYSNSDHIHVSYEFEFTNKAGKITDVVKPGQLIRIKNEHGTFKFRCIAHNVNSDSTWVDCLENVSGNFRSFPIEKLKGIVKPKKSRVKKPIT